MAFCCAACSTTTKDSKSCFIACWRRTRGMSASLLEYRPWQGDWRSSMTSVMPVARIALRMLFRRMLFWVLYAFALLIFLMFFFGQYLLAWAEGQTAEQTVRVGFFKTDPT